MHTWQKKLVAQTKLWTLQKFAFVFLCTVQICDFCIWKNICAADLRILCTTHFCTFAHLHICTFAHLQKVLRTWENVFSVCTVVEIILRTCSQVKLCLRTSFHKFSQFSSKSSKSRKSRNFRKCPILSRRFLTCSRKCPKKAHVFLSGTRVVPGPTRLTTQGGKSRQNMH